MKFAIRVLTKNTWEPFSQKLQELENVAEYPYGSDFFRIDHGSDYFGFFERMGEPVFHIALDGERVIACAAGILRKLTVGKRTTHMWYLCDLKVHPDYRGQRIPTQLFHKHLVRHYLRCGRGYAISMSPVATENKMVKLIQRFSWIPFDVSPRLNFFSLDAAQITNLRGAIEHCVGPISFLCLENKKDLVMRSTGEPMNLLHVQHGPFAEPQLASPQPDAVHMMCAVADSPLDQILQSRHTPSAQASVFSHCMGRIGWDFILTSDI